MKKLILIINLLYCSFILGQAQYLSNAVNSPTSVSNPSVFIGALPAPIGTFKVYIKEDIRWETYNINNFNNQVLSTTSLVYKPISYTPSSSEILFALGYTPIAMENDPIWTTDKTSYYNKTTSDSRYLQSYSETDPSVPSYAKTLSNFNIIKTNTDPLYRPITYVPAFVDITGKPTTYSGYGITDVYPLTGNPSSFLTSYIEIDPIVSARTLTINGTTLSLASNRTWTVGDLLSTGSYTNPSWLISLPYSKITGTPIITGGTVTSVGITGSELSITGSPVTSSGNIGLALSTTGITAGTYGRLTVDTKGRATAGKRQETYSGVTDSSGNYTVVFVTAYSVSPNIQICLINPNVRDTPVPTISNTGFTINVQRRVDVLGLLPTYGNVVGGAIDVLITEK